MTLASNRVEACQPELVEDPGSLVEVGYDRQRTTAVYVDTLSVAMKNKKKFNALLTSSCNGRRDATVAIEMRKEGSEEWEEMASEIKITARNYDDLKDLDPCSRYEIRVLIKPKHGGEERELSIFKVGPFHELDPADMAIAKFKGDGEQYYTDNFKPEYIDVTDHSFTVRWQPICALGINVFVKGEDEDWEEDPQKKITNDINDPTTELTFEVDSCKVYEVVFEFIIDSEGQEIFEQEATLVTISIKQEDLRDKFSKHNFDNSSKLLKWDYTALIDELECVESFSYKLVKDENGDIEQLLEGNDQDNREQDFDIGSLKSECNFGVRMEVEYNFYEDNVDSFEAFEEHMHDKDQKDNAINVNERSITYEINPCVQQGSKLAIGLAEIGREGKDLSGSISEDTLAGKIDVDESKTDIPRSSFEEMDLKSCVAYKIILLRRSDQDFKELETAKFENPRWNSWKAPSILVGEKSETSITLNITDLETDGECLVSHYNVSCYEADGDDTLTKVSDGLTVNNLLSDTAYNCSARIVHTIPGSGNLETPWADYVIIETAAAPLPEEDPTTEHVSEAEPDADVPQTSLSPPDVPDPEMSVKTSNAVSTLASITLLVISVVIC